MGKLVKGPWSMVTNDRSGLALPNSNLEFVAFDVETTGFGKNDRIIEIALVAFKDGKWMSRRE